MPKGNGVETIGLQGPFEDKRIFADAHVAGLCGGQEGETITADGHHVVFWGGLVEEPTSCCCS